MLNYLLLCFHILLLGNVGSLHVLILEISLNLADTFEFIALLVGSTHLLLQIGHTCFEEVLQYFEVFTFLIEESRVEVELGEGLLHTFEELSDLISLVDEDAADLYQVPLDFIRRLEVVKEGKTDVVLQRSVREGLHVGLVH